MTKQMQPKIRFKGFNGEWETKILGDISTTFSGGTPNIENTKYYGDLIPFIRSGEISLNKTQLFLTEEGLKNSSAKIVGKGDILYALYGATSGEVSRSKISGAINQAILAIIPISLINSDFIVQWLKKYKAHIVSIYLQGGQGNLSASIIKKLILDIPKLLEEQTKIGNFFQQLDKTIALHEQKHTQTLNLKKAMLEKMFPKAGCKQPEIRFKGFSGDWEAISFEESLQETNRPIKMEDNKEYQLITVKRRNEGIISRSILKGKDIFVKSQFEVKTGDYIISKRQVVHGGNGLLPSCLDGSIVSNEYLVAQGTDKMDINFFSILSTLPMMYQKFFLSSYGVDIEKLFFDVADWKKRTALVPKIKEQTKISNYFKQLDDTLALQAQQLKKLKNIKQACLEKMLV